MEVINFFQTILSTPTGSFAFVLALILGAIYLTHWSTKKITEITTEHNMIKGSTSKLETTLDEIKKDILYLKVNSEFKNSDLAQSHSPISLTKKGEEISKEINTEEMIARNWDIIYKDLEENISNKNAYDIQQYCIETASMFLDKFLCSEDMDSLKQYAYNTGKPISYYSILFAIPIRDKYLSIKGISADDIDKCDPNKKN